MAHTHRHAPPPDESHPSHSPPGGTQSGGDGNADGAGASQDRVGAPLSSDTERQKPAASDGATSVTQDQAPEALRCNS